MTKEKEIKDCRFYMHKNMCHLGLNHDCSLKCNENPNCYYKLLLKSQQEVERLTVINNHLNIALGARRSGKKTFIDLSVENKNLQQSLKVARGKLIYLKRYIEETFRQYRYYVGEIQPAINIIDQALTEINGGNSETHTI